MNKTEVTKQMQTLINQLNAASEAYYNSGEELMSNKEWDTLFDTLAELEQRSGIVLSGSPTQRVGSEISDDAQGTKVKHEFPALSLDKTKSIDELIKWADERDCVMSWKLDGCTLVLSYDDGKLSRIVTRGDGFVGTDITHLKNAISGIPQDINYKGHLVVRGECVFSYADFERINSELPENEEPYANPRNLVSGTLTLDNLIEVKSRNPQFIAFTLVHSDDAVLGVYNLDKWCCRMLALVMLGFNIVPSQMVKPGEVQQAVDHFTTKVTQYPFPVDGLVLCYNDWAYSQSGNVTGHHATRAGYAFKWADETVETKIIDIEWSDSRTGLFNPVAIFEPVQLCGTMVSRASLFNLSYVRAKDIKIGDRVTVYKANMIIPQVDKNLDADVQTNADWDFSCERHNIPKTCPHCGMPLGIKRTENADVVICENPSCSAKVIGSMVHFCERDCMNIMGLSKKKLQQLIDLGVIRNVVDIPELYIRYRENGNRIVYSDRFGNVHDLAEQPGWGEDSVRNLAAGIETACKNATFIKFIHAMGIPNVGRGQAKLLAPVVAEWMKQHQYVPDMMSALKNMVATKYDFTSVDGFGEVIVKSLNTWVQRELMCATDTYRVLQRMTFIDAPADYIKETSDSLITGKTFVVTGDVHIFKNRKEVEAKIEELGGKLSGSVSKKTDYLINNDIESTSSKNQKAKTLGVPIITEEQFCDMIGMK